jgi:hypothetical protein
MVDSYIKIISQSGLILSYKNDKFWVFYSYTQQKIE